MSYNKEKAIRQRKMVADIKVNAGCKDCGYSDNAAALEFDHRKNTGLPYSGKSRTVASMMHYSWTTLLKEIEKCDVVCANCHAIRTHKRRN